MQTIWTKRAAAALAGALVIAGVLWFAWPRPIAVDLAAVTKGPMEVTVDDEGKTRVRHVYIVSAPIAGKVLRISHPAGNHGSFTPRRRSGHCRRDGGRHHATDDAELHRCSLT